MLRLLNYVVGTILAALGVALLLAYFGNEDFRSQVGDAIDSAFNRDPSTTTETISAQAVVNLSESVVEVRNRSYTLGGLLDSPAGAGTGIIITEETPWIVVTAAHVPVEETAGLLSGQEILVRRPGRAWGHADVLERQSGPDIARLRVEFPSQDRVPPVTVPRLSAEPLGVGDVVVTMCYFDSEIRQGRVLELVRRVGERVNVVIDIPVEPGCSGAPLIDATGDLVGIVIQGSDEVSVAVVLDAH